MFLFSQILASEYHISSVKELKAQLLRISFCLQSNLAFYQLDWHAFFFRNGKVVTVAIFLLGYNDFTVLFSKVVFQPSYRQISWYRYSAVIEININTSNKSWDDSSAKHKSNIFLYTDTLHSQKSDRHFRLSTHCNNLSWLPSPIQICRMPQRNAW